MEAAEREDEPLLETELLVGPSILPGF